MPALFRTLRLPAQPIGFEEEGKAGSMIVPLVMMLLQTNSPPVHVWLDAPSPLARGAAVRVYVQVAMDGNLVVLQRRTDGHIGVLFPSSPAGAASVRAGTYEIRGPSDRPAFVVAEPDGQGMILAALATDPVQFNEFAREVEWNPDALIPSWGGTDAEGALTDIVQRMLGDGTFNYDLVTYTVAPAVYAQQESVPGYAPYSTCVGCTLIGTEVVVAAPFAGCDAFFGVCFGFPRFAHRLERRQVVAERAPSVFALNLRPSVGPVALAPRRALMIPTRDRSNAPIEPRKRLPDARPRPRAHPSLPARGEPAVLERPLAPHSGGAIVVRRLVAPPAPLPAAGASLTAPLRHVRFTRLSNPSTTEDLGRGGGDGVARSRGAFVPAASSVPIVSRPRATSWGALGTARASVAAATSDAAPATVPHARVTPATGAATPATRSLALPGAGSHAAGGRAGVARGGVARH